jgi:pimeloyl-ACP methyl ester carboxylesterase
VLSGTAYESLMRTCSVTELPGRDRLLGLPPNRTVSVWEGGDPKGLPVLFHHGTPAGRLQALLGHEAALRRSVRLFSFNRPGYGASTDTPPSLASVGSDTLQVADGLGIDEFVVMGVSGGGPYALATGLADPARVQAVGVLAGVGPRRLIGPADPDDPDLPLLALADAGDVDGALDGFRRQAATEFGSFLKMADEEMVAALFDGAPEEDIRWLDAAARRYWGADKRDALRTYEGYARDNVAWGADWDIDPSRLVPSAWLWYGERDRVAPPQHGQWLAAKVPSATLVVRPDKGHGATAFEFWDDVLATLCDQFSATSDKSRVGRNPD